MNDGTFQLRIEDAVRAILKQKSLIIVMTLIGLVAGGILTFMAYMQGEMDHHYTLKASIAVGMQTLDGSYAASGADNPVLADVQMANQIMESVIYVLDSDLLVETAMEDITLVGYSASSVSKALSVNRVEETLVAELSLSWNSEEEGTLILNAILDAAPAVLQETFQIGGVSVVTQPHVTREYGGTINKMMFVLVAALGMFGGIGVAVLQLFFRPTLMDLRDVENMFGLEIFGEIPMVKGYFDDHKNILKEAEEAGGTIPECFSSCAHILKNQLGQNRKNLCIYVTSAVHEEGKTLTAAYLAANLAAMEKRVLLIDFDIKKPTLGNLFLGSVKYEQSMNAVYKGDIELVDAILPLNAYLDILPSVLARNSIPLDNTILEVVRMLKQKYDYVIMDTAPVGLSSNTMNLNQVADTTLFVIRHDFASMSDIRNALARLDKSGIQVIGCVVNEIQTLDHLLGTGKKKDSTNKRGKTKDKTADASREPYGMQFDFMESTEYDNEKKSGYEETGVPLEDSFLDTEEEAQNGEEEFSEMDLINHYYSSTDKD